MTTSCRRSFFLLAACLLLTLLVVAFQAGPVAARALPVAEQQEGGEDYHVFLPLISNIPANTISGQVTLNGLPAGEFGFILTLELFSGNTWERSVKTTTIDANGRYAFKDVPNLPAGKHYEVWFENTLDSQNIFYGGAVWLWVSQPIDDNTAFNINFDITNVEMGNVSSSQHIPTTFTWLPRPAGPEYYQFLLFSTNFDPFFATDILPYTSYKLMSLPAGFYMGINYCYSWAIGIIDAQGGFGISRPQNICFYRYAPTYTFSGRVTNNGIGVPGIVLTLELTERNYWYVIDKATTDADGSYHFDNVTTPPAGQYYEIWYENASEDNPFHVEYLSYWGTQPIDLAQTANINFDIAEVNLHELNSQETLPVLFSWSSRAAAPEKYWFTLRGLTGEPYFEPFDPIPTNTFLMNNLPHGFMLNQQYYWGVRIESESSGRGHSLIYPIAFVESGSDTLSADELQLQANYPQVIRRDQLPRR